MLQSSSPSSPVVAAMEHEESPREARILVIEDNAILGTELCGVCAEFGAHAIGPVHLLRDVERILDEEGIDAATVDINLGGGLEYDVSDCLAAAGVPFIFISGYGQASVPERHAANPFLQKPVPIDDLKAWLAAALGRVSKPQSA